MMRVLLAVAAAVMLTLAGCERREPTAGERLDRAIDQTQKTAKETGEQAEKTVEESREAIKDATE